MTKGTNSHKEIHEKRRQLAVLGTMSDAGKSTLTAGICRVLTNAGIKVAPFKAQNMSNNAAPALLPNYDQILSSNTLDEEFKDLIRKSHSTKNATDDSSSTPSAEGGYGEIGTAQALQAEACHQIPRVEMNPVLLKSGGRRESDGAYLCSIVVLGKQVAVEDYGSLGKRTNTLLNMVVQSVSHLQNITKSDIIVLEGAGSCTEMNLMNRDIVNIPLVRKLNCPWLLVANIDPGGVFAQIVGTKACLASDDWDLCAGIIVNKLRGETKYFEPGPSMLEKMVGKPIYVVPYLYNINLPEEDGLGVERRIAQEHKYNSIKNENLEIQKSKETQKPVIVVVAYPHVAITDDLTPLESDSRFEVEWRRSIIPQIFPHTTCIILPGSRLSLSDLLWLTKETGWGECIKSHVEAGGHILGLCGGYQMLGMVLDDSLGIEGIKGKHDGLGLLPVETSIEPASCKIVEPQVAILLDHSEYKETREAQETSSKQNGLLVKGFELHCGRTNIVKNKIGSPTIVPLLHYLNKKVDGIQKEEGIQCGNVKGTYLHGILKSAAARRILLLGKGESSVDCTEELEKKLDEKEDPLDRLAHHLEHCGLGFDTLSRMVGLA